MIGQERLNRERAKVMYVLELDNSRGILTGSSISDEQYALLDDKYKGYWIWVDDNILTNTFDYMDDNPFE